jgi:hypothetical protein
MGGNWRSHDRRQNLAALAGASLSNHCSARYREHDVTRAEFIERCKASQRTNLFNVPWNAPSSEVWLVLGAFFGAPVFAFAAALAVYWQEYDFKWTLCFVVFLLVNSWCVGWFNNLLRRRQCRKAGLVCPACGTLFQEYLAAIAIATGKCGGCGQPVLDDKGT